MIRKLTLLIFCLTMVLFVPVLAQTTSHGTHPIPGTEPNPLAKPGTSPGAATEALPIEKLDKNLPNKIPNFKDSASHSMTLVDLLEYSPSGADSNVRWDIESWKGGDFRRWRFKTEGERNVHSSEYEADFQLLRSKLVHSYTEFQYGIRLQTQGEGNSGIARPQAVVGYEALMPYNYELDTALYLDPHGHLSGSITAEKDLLLTQRLILQPRFESTFALQQDKKFGEGAGLNDITLGLRLRYEIRREFAPYIGITYNKAFGKTASFRRQDGEDVGKWRFVAGVRMWF